MASTVTLAAIARAAKLPPAAVTKTLFAEHGVSTVPELKALLANAEAARALPPLWREPLHDAIKKLVQEPIATVQWCPNGDDTWPRIVVIQGDLTTCEADAIVNAANSQLSHGGGLAGAIAKRGGRVIRDESQAWIREHRSLAVGKAMVTSSGELPCNFVIHTVGPNIASGGKKLPTPAQAQQLRNAVWSVLCEAETLGLETIAIPGISSGIYGYPRDLAAREILSEGVRFCRTRSAAGADNANATTTTSLKTIAFMNNDTPTCESFLKALEEAAGRAGGPCNDNPFVRVVGAGENVRAEPSNDDELVDALARVQLDAASAH